MFEDKEIYDGKLNITNGDDDKDRSQARNKKVTLDTQGIFDVHWADGMHII